MTYAEALKELKERRTNCGTLLHLNTAIRNAMLDLGALYYSDEDWGRNAYAPTVIDKVIERAEKLLAMQVAAVLS